MDKKMTSALNAYTEFKALPNESLQSTFKIFKVIMSRLKNFGNEKSNLEVNLKFINGLGEAWITVQIIIQGSGNLRKMSLYDLFNDLQAQESTILSIATKNGVPKDPKHQKGTQSTGLFAEKGKGTTDDEEIRCHNCQGLNYFTRYCKAKKKEETTGDKA
ncbi:hypothetical protein LXL04_023823 [Taraxacum kok-saghyz]